LIGLARSASSAVVIRDRVEPAVGPAESAMPPKAEVMPGMKKRPSISELLDRLKLLMVEDIGPETLRERDPKKLIPPLHGALIKNEQEVHPFERLAFMARREGR
jgi:hypothetical protein